MKKLIALLISISLVYVSNAEDGYQLWLRYKPIEETALLTQYRNATATIYFPGTTPTLLAAKQELKAGLESMLGRPVVFTNGVTENRLIIGTPTTLSGMSKVISGARETGSEGFTIMPVKGSNLLITANTDAGILYGVFHYLRLMQLHQSIQNFPITSQPKIKLRLLNHWDNLNRTVERGYAGFSIWDWHKLPGYIDQRYIDYARANASIGINGTVLTNVNANALILTPAYLGKIAALANTFRPYGIKVYLTARFSASIEIGKLKTADPLDETVRQWWQKKIDTIYQFIPDFGGFLVKANSEGQPGPQNYNRSHADGTNMLADAVAPHGGIVMWRAFVYNTENAGDRFQQAYNEFHPLDGKFKANVLVQVKNGPIDFQPREPFSPLFGAMPQTPLMMEYQITQEYLGQATQLVYEAPLMKEVLDADTYEKGSGSTVAKVIDGSLENHSLSGMAGVSNIGNDRNWTGHPFAQANWYAFGRLAWNDTLSSATIADEWLRQTFSNSLSFVTPVKQMMLRSREIMVNYMTPLGLHHIMGNSHHYGPAPWSNRAPRADWDPIYYHKADSIGIGFDRTATGSNALAQYQPPVAAYYASLQTCPDSFLLWYHHVPWTYKMKSGRTLWDELCYRYNSGVDSAQWMQQQWNLQKGKVDDERFEQVKMLLGIQVKEAVWWRNACLLYFQTFSKMPIPANYEKPDHTLEYYQSLRFPYAPGI